MSVSVYIAAPFQTMAYAKRVMEELEDAHINVTSSWLKKPVFMTSEQAQEDLDDVDAADILVALNPDGWANTGTGGRHFEAGYAEGKGKPILLVGEQTNIFHLLRKVHVIDETESIVKHVLDLYGTLRIDK